ncbi:hypothetical protein KGV31_002148 [Vibrio parahaemolyticus]|nr:hypothetical protein [Vibrio parahaemolyticus]EHU0344291.1 hypothetical protein [Vibrio parahaemolyticus]EHU0354325.1 hypothetical protein [Vibrio parahaemolyticus]
MTNYESKIQTTINAQGQEVDCYGRVKYISPTGIVSFHFPCDLPSKKGYTKPPQTTEHKLRVSEALRGDNPVWDHFDSLYEEWKDTGMMSGYHFGKYVRESLPHIQGAKTFRFDNMVKHFRNAYEDSMSLENIRHTNEIVAIERMTNVEPKHEYVVPKRNEPQGNWWDDVDFDDEDSYFIGRQ